MLYPILNLLCHLVHGGVVVFLMVGWLFPPLRAAHLALVFLTLGSWFILGRWFGVGYCPITDWHWKLKDALGEGRPKEAYIHMVLQKIARRKFEAAAVDKVVVLSTLAVTALSLALNLGAWLTA